jgi:hypothetical protein
MDMYLYLFTRRTRLVAGHGMAAVEWAGSICAKVKDLTGQEMELWARVYAPGVGTISWTGWFDDLAALEAVGDTLEADASFSELADAGATFTDGSLDDGLLQPVDGEPDGTPVQYVATASATVAAGHMAQALTAGVAIARQAQAITGRPTLFARSVTGPPGGVGWLTGYEDIATLEKAASALAGDPSLLTLLDATTGCFAADAPVIATTLYRKLG